MKPSAIAAAILLALLAACVFIVGPMIADKAQAIDNLHWQGYPLTPCFVDATHCGGHVLGSDENGRDLVARLIVGGSVTLGTALLALFIELAIAFALALLAAHGGRAVDSVVMALGEGMGALPRVPFSLLLAITTFSMMPKGVWPNTFEIALWFGVIFWPALLPAFRARTSSIGVTRRAIADLITILLVSSTIEFFGYGHMPPTPTWGSMLANAESDFEIAWWASVFPGLCIFGIALLLDIVRRGLPPAHSATERCESVLVSPSPV